MSFHSFVQALVDGISIGSSYAILALAFTLLWATVRTVNMALLQVVAIGGLVAYWLAGAGVVVAIAGAVLASLLVGVLTHYVAVETTVRKGLIYPIIASIGAGLLIEGVLTLVAGDNILVMPNLLPQSQIDLGGIYIGWTPLIVFVITAGMLAAAGAVAKMTDIGLGFRASAWRPELAAAYGVNVGQIRLISASAAAVAAGFAGISLGIVTGSVSPYLGTDTGINGLVAMLIGGAGNPLGAVAAGLLVGLIQSISGLFVSSSMQSVISLGLLFLLMVVRPAGIMKAR